MEQADLPSLFEFTPEQVKVLSSKGGEPLQVSVKETNKVYLVIEEGVLPSLDEEYIRQGLAHAADQMRRNETASWDLEEIKSAGRNLLAQQKRHS